MKLVKRLILGVVLNGLALYAVTQIVSGVNCTGGIKVFVLGGIVIGLLNTIVKPILKLISIPFIFLSLGLFLIVINGAMLWLMSYILEVAKFRDVTLNFSSIGTLLIAAVVFGLINWVEHLFFKNK